MYDGHVIAEENMVTIGQLELIRSGQLANPYTERFGPEGSAMPGGHSATHTYSELADDSKWRFGLIFMAPQGAAKLIGGGSTPGSEWALN